MRRSNRRDEWPCAHSATNADERVMSGFRGDALTSTVLPFRRRVADRVPVYLGAVDTRVIARES